MGLYINIEHGYMPDPKEKWASFGYSKHALPGLVKHLGYKRLDKLDRDLAIEALIHLVEELDKGEGGEFNTDYWKDSSYYKTWLRKYSTDELSYFRSVYKVSSNEEVFAKHRRRDWRQTAIRFMLYYQAGYEIEYIP